MCGFIGGNNYLINENEIKISLEKIYHRGPDGYSYDIDNNIFIGHTRLSIVGLNNGKQPIWNKDKSIVISVNGEFYNYEEIKTSLINKGYVFTTNTDSEILLYLYELYGVDCLNYLHGEFAFILYDKRKKLWFCARDRLGIKPIQFYYKNKMFIVGSEAKSIISFKNVETELNKDALWFSQHLQYLPLDKTLFKNIEMIKPAHYIIVKENEPPKQFEYWSLKDIKEEKYSFNEVVEKSKELIIKSVEKRIPKEVEFATHLSGGIDSSIITALSKNYNDKLNAFTVKFSDNHFYDESSFAIETANKLNVNLNIIDVNFKDMLSVLPSAIYHAEGLAINGHISAKYILNKAIKDKGFKVTLSGEGSDEIFMGYSHLKNDYLTNKMLSDMEKQYLNGVQLPDGNQLNTDIIKNTLGYVPTWINAKASMAYKLKDLWSNQFINDINPYENIMIDLNNSNSKLKNSSISWMKYCLSGYILKSLDDAQAMAHGVEGRIPFLDTELIEFMYSVHDELYFHNNVEKAILRTGFKNELPESVINKTKQSFMSPPMNTYINDKLFVEMLNDYVLNNRKFKEIEVYDVKKIEKLIKDKNITNNYEPIIMTILSLAILNEDLL